MLNFVALVAFSILAVQELVILVEHLGQNRDGWHVAQTKHFRIFHKQEKKFAEKVAQIAEATRLKMNRKWFGNDGDAWDPVCELILHEDGQSYTQMTGVSINSPGHSRIEADPGGRVITRRMDLRHDVKGMIEAILPHETTHVVLAGQFGNHHTPRWADEGIAVLSEPDKKIDLHRKNLAKCARDPGLFPLKELMELKDYPQPRRIGTFYAQSVCLTEFMVKEKSPVVFTKFVCDGLAKGYEVSLQHHYGYDFAGLEERWQKFLVKEELVSR